MIKQPSYVSLDVVLQKLTTAATVALVAGTVSKRNSVENAPAAAATLSEVCVAGY